MNEIEIESIGGACPCQAEGLICGHPFYFRARHGQWTLNIVKPGCDPVIPKDPLFHFKGDDPDDGFMSVPEAMRTIGQCYKKARLRLEGGDT